MKKIDIYFILSLIIIIWLSWIIGINLIKVNQVVYYYKPYPNKILLADKNLLYIFPLAFSIFIFYNFLLSFLGFNKRLIDIINTFLFVLNFIIFIKLFYLNY